MSMPAVTLRTRIADAAARRARLTVVPLRRRPPNRVPFAILVTVILVAGVIGLLVFNTSMQQGSFRAAEMEDRARTLQAREQILRMQLDRLSNPQRLAQRAQRLGMVPAVRPAFLRLSDGKVLGDPEPATAEDGMRIRPLPPTKPPELAPEPEVRYVPPKPRLREDPRGASPRSEPPIGRNE